MADQDYITKPIVLSDGCGREWIGGPLEVLPDLDDALAEIPFDDWKMCDSLIARVVWMVPDNHATDENCLSENGGDPNGCGCWRETNDKSHPDAAPFWEFNFDALPPTPSEGNGR